MNDTLTALDRIRVGHAELDGAPSGCTVVLPDGGAVAGVDVRGGAPATFNTNALNPLNLVDRVDALVFSGGSAFGSSVADGVRHYLKERDIGFDSGHGKVPIVVGANIFDLGVNQTGRYPDASLGRRAVAAATREPVTEGCVGAGLGATVGKLYRLPQAMKSGLGSACVRTRSGVLVAALMVVNAFGDVIDPALGRPIAGCRTHPEALELLDSESEIECLTKLSGFPDGHHTVVGAVACNVQMNKTQLTKVAQMAHDGLARTVYPAHTLFDGDTIFALSAGDLDGVDVTVIGALAARVTAEAILRAVRKATGIERLPACSDLLSG